MKRVQKITALFLCFLMMFQSQAMASPWEGNQAFEGMQQTADEADTDTDEHIEETLPLSPIEPSDSGDRIQETLPLTPLDRGSSSWEGGTAIYWNPGKSLHRKLSATDSNALENGISEATPSDTAKADESAEGFSPNHPVKTMEAALDQAAWLEQEQGVDRADITIYAMSPMVIPDGKLFVLNAGGVRIASWPGRSNGNDTIFYLKGGQLTLSNAVLESGKNGSEEAELIRIDGGALQMGKGVLVNGRIVMDYRDGKANIRRQKASDSDEATVSHASAVPHVSTQSNALIPSNMSISSNTPTPSDAFCPEEKKESGQMQESGFDIDSYGINTEEDEWEFFEDSTMASTWREPVIELIDGFDGRKGGCLIELRGDRDLEDVTLARTLYADDVSGDDFAAYFRLADNEDHRWTLIPAIDHVATVRDTGVREAEQYRSMNPLLLSADQGVNSIQTTGALLTRKTLTVSRASGGRNIYWNPGPSITVNDTTYPAGDDSVDGNTAISPVKTLQMAMERANGGTVTVMQTVNLGSAGTEGYLTEKEGEAWLVKAPSAQFIPTLKMWNVTSVPLFTVPAGQKLILENVRLEGPDKGGVPSDGCAVEVNGGDLTIRENVTAQEGFIQIKPSASLKDHPVQADSITGVAVTLFFSEINGDLRYRSTDVVVPTEALLPAAAAPAEKTAMGQALMGCYSLSAANRLPEAGGSSYFDWKLRPDQAEDDRILNDQNLELYTEYYYNAVYLDGVNGDDLASGATWIYPVKTWGRAREIWEQQMTLSKDARKAAHDAGMAPDEIDRKYPNPDVIYICGTVTVNDNQLWELPVVPDYDGTTPVVTEVAVNKEPPVIAGADTPVYTVPDLLADVVAGGSLTLKDIQMRNDSDIAGSRTVRVSGAGAKLTLAGTTRLTGTLSAESGAAPKDTTKGSHIQALAGGQVIMDGSWTGSVEKRQQGVTADGAGTAVSMEAGTTGSIRENNTLGDDITGAGVALSGGASFTMDGGTVTGNKTTLKGGGVSLAGAGTTFQLNKGAVSDNTLSWMGTGSFTRNRAYGLGIYAESGTTVNIGTGTAAVVSDAKVSGNQAAVVSGSGIYSNGSLNIKKAEISGNTGGSVFYDDGRIQEYAISHGIGVYVDSSGSLNMDGAKVSDNKITGYGSLPSFCQPLDYGSGIGIYISPSTNAAVLNSEISGNLSGGGSPGSDGDWNGGGIYTGGSLDIQNTAISGNRAAVGAGIAAMGGSLTITGSVIRGNIAGSDPVTAVSPSPTGQGGGLYLNTKTSMKDSKVEANGAETGGGICLVSQPLLARGVLISGNTGSGVSASAGSMYFEDVKITGNTAKNGGGVGLDASQLYWSESAAGNSALSGNNAAGMGGGIYSANGGNTAINLDFKGEIKNSANGQGSNLYLLNSSIGLLNGTLKQPALKTSGIYNVYLTTDGTGISSLGMNPQTVSIEKKTGTVPDAVYLDTANSYLRYFQPPLPGAAQAGMPVDVNIKAFKAGSIIIKPENTDRIQMYRPNAGMTDQEGYVISYAARLTDASIGLSSASGGTIPRRTQLGGMKDPANSTLTNAVLLGEGVYLAGTASGGSDAHGGTSPEDAVATFERAKAVLKEKITSKSTQESGLPAAERQGFSPYIYICGNIPVNGNTDWELDYTASLYSVTNKAFADSERTANPELPADDDSLKAQVRRFTSFVSEPMITVEGAGSAFHLGRILIDGMAEGVSSAIQGNNSPVIFNGAGTVVSLSGETQIFNNWGIGIKTDGSVILDGMQGDPNKQLKDIEGKAVLLNAGGAGLEMKGYSRIIAEGSQMESAGGVNRYGVYASLTAANSSAVVMKDYSSIEKSGSGAWDIQSGIYASGIQVQLQGHAQIRNTIKGVWLADNGNQFSMNSNPDGKADDSAGITGSGDFGIYVTGNGWQVSMGQQSRISGGGSGISFLTASSSLPVSLDMDGGSSITANKKYGIEIPGTNNAQVKITMKGNAGITRNQEGIHGERQDGYAGDSYLTLSMGGGSHVSANASHGVCLAGGGNYLSDKVQDITLRDQAVIGGKTPYVADATVEDCGNGGNGLYTTSLANILLSGTSSISGNSGDGFQSKRVGNGTNRKTFTMEGSSTVSSNGGYGIDAVFDSSTDNQVNITMRDGAFVGNNQTVGSQNQDQEQAEIYLPKGCELHLEGASRVSAAAGKETAVTAAGGKLYLDGTAAADGLIHLQTRDTYAAVAQPVTLQSPVSPDSKKFRLYVADSMLGKAVVIPDGTVVTDASKYLPNFVKEKGDGLAAEKLLVPLAPNIILEGENNVYLSGRGQDSNDGNSPTNAVRTFHRARELLRTGYYKEGANIIIDYMLTITSWTDTTGGTVYDTDWSFDEGGTVTNVNTGATWRPVVMRDKALLGNMISLIGASSIVFKNITLDGNRENSTKNYSVGSMIFLNNSRGKVVLGEGAVLQNNYQGMVYQGSLAPGILVKKGTLEMNGGTIQTMAAKISGTWKPQEAYGTAVTCDSADASFLFHSGQIRNNTMEGFAARNAGAVAIKNGASFTMEGGIISDNKNICTLSPTDQNQVRSRGGGLYVMNGKAEISGGIIRNNKGNVGSAVCYYGEGANPEKRGVTISGGQITGNTVGDSLTVAPVGEYAPVNIGGENFRLAGRGGNITDAIYLAGTAYPITVGGDINQPGRLYKVFLNQGSGTGQFGKGSIVVRPDGIKKTDVTPDLSVFQLMSAPLVLDGGQLPRLLGDGSSIMENQCLLLMQGVFLDGENGADTRNGESPRDAVRTFTKAKEIGGRDGTDAKDYYIIYICGKTTNTADEPVWTMPSPAYMCRYTGFSLYQKDGSPIDGGGTAYNGYLLEPQHDLTIERLALYGRRQTDPDTNNGDSLIHVQGGVAVTVQEGVDGTPVLGRNYNIGQYINPETGLPVDLSGRGGAFTVEPGGILDISAGQITGTDATYGSAVFLAADSADPAKTGRLLLSGKPEIGGTVHLSGTGVTTAAFVEPQSGYAPAPGSRLQITIENDYNGRPCLKYPEASPPGPAEMDYYSFADSINAIYAVTARASAPNIIELDQKSTVYLDGTGGNDSNSGTTPEQAFQTLKQVYTYIREQQAAGAIGEEGTVVYVAGTVTLDSTTAQEVELNNHQKKDAATGTVIYEGYYQDAGTAQINVKGQVSFKRYAQPEAYVPGDPAFDGYGKPALLGELFVIGDGGELTLAGTYLDGHSQEMKSSNPLYASGGVEALAPLITVKTGGKLTGQFIGAESGVISIPTMFSNNRNGNRKTNVIGTLNGASIIEGSGGGIELLGGSAELNHVTFQNLSLGTDVVSGGTDIYHFGADLSVYNQTLFSGTVFLEGFGTIMDPESQKTSRFLSVKQAGAPVQDSFQILLRDSYKGRRVVQYDKTTSAPSPQEMGLFRLEEQVKKFFALIPRETDDHVLDLLVPTAVYVDGINGNDSPTDVAAGSTPKTPVKTLGRAYDLLKTRGGYLIQVVNTVQVSEDTEITGTQYKDASGVNIKLGNTDKVELMRYIQPDFAHDGSMSPEEVDKMGYAVPDFTGPLVNVTGNSLLSVGDNFTIDGHSETMTGKDCPKELLVTHKSTSKAPLLTVGENAEADILDGSLLCNNHNDYQASEGAAGSDGGGVGNYGTVTADGAAFLNLMANKGAAVYQAGTFTIQSGAEKVSDYSFYLAAANKGTDSAPIWEDSVLQIAQAIPDGKVFDLDMDHAAAGREVIRFTDSAAYAPELGADLEYVHFRLGNTVSEDQFLVEGKGAPEVLELQDWKVLKAEVPDNIYLVVHRKGTMDSTTELGAVRAGTPELLSTPEYKIKNQGPYPIRVSVAGIDDQSAASGITQDAVNLKASAAEVIGAQDMYLAIKGLDSDPANGFTAPETALLAGGAGTPALMGQLNPGSTGTFGFTGAVGVGFVDHYKDPSFPLTDSAEDVMKYLDGTSVTAAVNARARFLLKYKVVIAR